jgi:hypothetical protein
MTVEKAKEPAENDAKREGRQTEVMSEAALAIATKDLKKVEELERELEALKKQMASQAPTTTPPQSPQNPKELVQNIGYGDLSEVLEQDAESERGADRAKDASKAPDEPSTDTDNSVLRKFANTIKKSPKNNQDDGKTEKKKEKSKKPPIDDSDPVARAAAAVEIAKESAEPAPVVQQDTPPIDDIPAEVVADPNVDYVAMLKSIDADRLEEAIEWLTIAAQKLNDPGALVISEGSYYLEVGMYHALTIRLLDAEYRQGFAKWLRNGELYDSPKQWSVLNAINDAVARIIKSICRNKGVALVSIKEKRFWEPRIWRIGTSVCEANYCNIFPGEEEIPEFIDRAIDGAAIEGIEEPLDDKKKIATDTLTKTLEKLENAKASVFEVVSL